MPIDPEKISSLVSEIRNEIGSGDEELVLKRREHKFVYLVENQVKKSRFKRIYIAGAAAVLAITFAGFIWFSKTDTTDSLLKYTVYHAHKPDENASKAVGHWIPALEEQESEIQFSQGSRFVISKASSVRILSHTQRLVHIELYNGGLHAQVKGNGITQWQISVGPFQLSVLGTRFDVSWQLPENKLNVNIHKGVVLVNGGSISSHGIRLYEGQSLFADSRDGDYRVVTGQTDTAAPVFADSKSEEAAIEPSENDEETQQDSTLKNTNNALNSRVRHKEEDAWQIHYENNDYIAAKNAVLSSGLSSLLQTASIGDLWKISQLFRNVGDSSNTERTLLEIRERYPKSSQARIAAFLLGRTKMEEQNNPKAAAEWFEQYIKESPKGSMIQEAYNRLFSIYSSHNRTEQARDAAGRYLKLFPEGVYVLRAKQLYHP